MNNMQSIIREIQRDDNLSQEEKREKIMQVMHEFNARALQLTVPVRTPCSHYDRHCDIIANCCQERFSCRLCHDEYSDHKINRFETKEIICRNCETRQVVSNLCIGCGVQFGEYFCEICRLWINSKEGIEIQVYHCEGCGICNKGSSSNIKHCYDCGICWNTANTHICPKDVKMLQCSICLENVYQSVDGFIALKCQHTAHQTCLLKLLEHDVKCPLCKKSAWNVNWQELDDLIAMQPMPEELIDKKVSILCNDCLTKSETKFHFLGNKCDNCGSYNTTTI